MLGITHVGGTYDAILIKFDSNGNRIWAAMVGTVSSDMGRSVSIDGTGAVFVAGNTGASLHSEPYAGSNDIFLMKYDSNGTRIWTKMVGTAADDQGRGLAVDVSSGVVLVLGASDLSKAFEANAAFGDGSAASKASIVLSIFASIWAAGVAGMLYFYDWKKDAKK
eukprot:gene25396-30666_t